METQEIEKRQAGPVAVIKRYLSDEQVKRRLEETLGKRGPAFANSIINVVRNSKQLQKCTPASVMSAAMIAATMNLPVDPVLGQAAIVPYNDQACFQLMYRGIIQLCIRSGQYKDMNCSEIFADELKSYNPITGEVTFHDPATYKMRFADKNDNNVVGHYAYFKLVSGFEKSEYMTKDEVMAHAKKYSKAYQYDLSQKKGTSAWSTDPVAMGNKTVLIKLLKRYGIMSIEMQDALVADRETFEEAQVNATKRIEAEQGSEPIDTTFEENGEREPEIQAKIDEQKAALENAEKPKRGRSKKAAKPKNQKPTYHCDGCNKDIDEVNAEDKVKGWQCPHCLSWRVRKNNQEQMPPFMED
jgi:recombination protein RecT